MCAFPATTPRLFFVLVLTCLSACAPAPTPFSPMDWQLPPGTPPPQIPDDNPMNHEKVTLGRRLFYDKRLSGNRTQSCATCHLQRLAFTDGKKRPKGSTGDLLPLGSMSLANVGYRTRLTRANPLLHRLEQHALVPLFGEFPTELGLVGQESDLFATLAQDNIYLTLFSQAFPEQQGRISLETITKALAAFQRTLISRNSPYDRWKQGKSQSLSALAHQGYQLFFSNQLRCFRCHGGIDFNEPRNANNQSISTPFFHNTGLYALDAQGAYPKQAQGLYAITHESKDMGSFRAPTLRNIEVTAPYMHDGSITTLQQVLEHYASGGRVIQQGPLRGDGRKNPWKSPLVSGFSLTKQERTALLAFLRSLTDRAFLQNPNHSDPFTTNHATPP